MACRRRDAGYRDADVELLWDKRVLYSPGRWVILRPRIDGLIEVLMLTRISNLRANDGAKCNIDLVKLTFNPV